jgi:hypothetical protein
LILNVLRCDKKKTNAFKRRTNKKYNIAIKKGETKCKAT